MTSMASNSGFSVLAFSGLLVVYGALLIILFLAFHVV
jgi:hypothetical protein